MTAAITAAERGHTVTLFEMGERLGGLLNYTDKDQKFKRDLHLFKEKLVARVGELPIQVKLNTKLTPDMVKEGKPDALLIAIGAVPIFPPIPGLTAEAVTTGYDCYSPPRACGAQGGVHRRPVWWARTPPSTWLSGPRGDCG